MTLCMMYSVYYIVLLCSIYIVLGIISNLEMAQSIEEDI